MEPGPLLTLAEAGDISGLGLRYITRLVAEKRLTSYKIGGKRLVARADLTAFIEQYRQEAMRPV